VRATAASELLSEGSFRGQHVLVALEVPSLDIVLSADLSLSSSLSALNRTCFCDAIPDKLEIRGKVAFGAPGRGGDAWPALVELKRRCSL
jgi:hypothetical protein